MFWFHHFCYFLVLFLLKEFSMDYSTFFFNLLAIYIPCLDAGYFEFYFCLNAILLYFFKECWTVSGRVLIIK